MKTRARNASKGKKEDKDPELEIVDTLKDASREEKRREANKPLYLVRYE